MSKMKRFGSPDEIAAEGERLYAEKHMAKLEAEHTGHFAAIDVLTGEAYVAEFRKTR